MSADSSLRRYDAIVVGAGINGLVAAVYLARAGWRTLVLEGRSAAGGAVKSGELTRPGFVHDLFATNMNPFRGSPVFRQLGPELEAHGLRFAVGDRPFVNVFPGGKALRVYRGVERTIDELACHDGADARGWAELDQMYQHLAPTLFKLLGSRPDPRELAVLALAEARHLKGGAPAELAQLLVSSTRELGESYLHSPEAQALMACWGLHLDCAPDVAGGALTPFIEAFTDMRAGISVVEGGASRLIDALVAVGRGYGLELRTEAEVARVSVGDGRATGVELVSGEYFEARRAVIANLTPALLYGRLLADVSVPAQVRRAAGRYRYGPATMMVHLALSRPLRWEAGSDLDQFGYVHIGPFVDDLSQMYAEATAGLLPVEPMLIVGQTSSIDSSRSPDGAVLWIQVRALPPTIRGDATGAISSRSWDGAGEAYADRVVAKLERYAPGVGETILDRCVFTPADLERQVPTLVGGDSIGGSAHMRQNFFLRPFPEVRDYGTGVGGLYMVGSATWPGGGVSAMPGFNLAQKLLAPPPRRRDDVRLIGTALREGGALLRRSVGSRQE